VIRRLTTLLLIAICVACKPSAPETATKTATAAGPTVRATVVTIRTTTKPEQRTDTQTLVIAGERARDTGELDTWRLYDTKSNTVTFVDDIAKTIRTQPMQLLVTQRRVMTRGALPPHYPRARLVRPGTKKPMHGVPAELFAIESGAYKRELWMADHPAIPSGLFAMMRASQMPTAPLAPMMLAVDEALIAMRGFPLAEHTEVPVAKDQLIIDRTVVSIAGKDVPQTLLAVPKDYRYLTPAAPTRR
jgi:hypothetical protein